MTSDRPHSAATDALRNLDGFAIYISTMRSDYRLAKALVASLEAFIERPPIIIIPDDDHRGDAMFGYPTWRPEDSRVAALVGYYKKLRIFWGPAKRFVHLDADQLALRDPVPWIRTVIDKRGPFFIANRKLGMWPEWEGGDDRKRARIFSLRVGDISLISEFDPQFDWQTRYPLNSGEFAASRDAVDGERLLATFRRARDFHRQRTGSDDLCHSRRGLFMSDQGFLHYFLVRHCPHAEFEWVDDLFCSGSTPDGQLGATELPWKATFVHWAGCTRPGPLPLSVGVPHARAWRRSYLAYCRSRRDWIGALVDSAAHLWLTARDAGSVMKRRLGSV
jgi:hypothetical protein